MTRSARLFVAPLVAVLIGGASFAATAQEPKSQATPPAATNHHFGPQRMCQDQEARMASRLAYAEVKLNLTDQQKPAWKKLTDTLKSAQDPVRKVCAEITAQQPPTALPDKLQQMQKLVDAHSAQLKTSVPAVAEFYGQLTPQQKQIADTQLMPGHGMRGHHGMHHGMGQGGQGRAPAGKTPGSPS